MTCEFKNILIIQLRRIGDVLLTTPAIEVLRKNFPNSKIDFLVEKPCNETVIGNPFINNILIYDKKTPLKWIRDIRRKKYDLVIDFLSNPRSALITTLSGAKIKAGPQYTSSKWAYNLKLPKNELYNKYNPFLKIDLLKPLKLKKIFYPYPKIYVPSQDCQWAKKELLNFNFKQNDLIIGFSPASRRNARQWPKEHFIELAKLITTRLSARILVFWGPGEKTLAKEIVQKAALPKVFIAPQTPSILKLAAMFNKIDLLISNFNGAKHIAQAVNIPTLGICSYDLPENWTPINDDRYQTIKLDLNCNDCRKNSCKNNFKCLTDLKPEIVYAKLNAMLKKLSL